jgi:L-ascorbate metabolism protein UlaG (beta-lactamase superfamily)
MILTKHAHATVTLTSAGKSIIIDPGAYTPNALDLLVEASSVFFTHNHFDHFDAEAVRAAHRLNPTLRVYGPRSVIEKLAGFDGHLSPLAPGDRIEVDGFSISVFGGEHAVIHPELPQSENLAYLVNGTVLHPGDAYVVPGVPVGTLLVPTSGPWTKMGDAIDYVRAVHPQRSIQIHEGTLNAIGIESAARFLGADGLTGIPLLTLAPSESVEI